jgi:hypothetical protein
MTDYPTYTHQPFLDKYIRETTGDVIEFGAGDGSTGLICKLLEGTGRKLVTVENSIEWLERMKSVFPENDQHEYIFTTNWYNTIQTFPKDRFDVIFIDQNPWMARKWTMDYFKNSSAKYVIIHDVDYFPVNGIFGKRLGEFTFDFSEQFKDYNVYYPEKPWPYKTGPPTLVGTNNNQVLFEESEILKSYNPTEYNSVYKQWYIKDSNQ